MQRSANRILTTHAGSLPRPARLEALLLGADNGEPAVELESEIRQAVAHTVRQQIEAGLDVINDGEMGKISYATYVTQRLTGFDGDDAGPFPEVESEFPEFAARVSTAPTRFRVKRPTCTGPIRLKNHDAVQHDIQNLRTATEGVQFTQSFISAASPGVIALFFPNDYYPTHEQYLQAIAEAMKPEYEALAAAGFVVQLDCPDLAGARHMATYARRTINEFLAYAEHNIEALNAATSGIPPDQLRMHVCWGNYEGPHNHDIPLHEIVGLLLNARPNAISLEGANPRHEHEWEVFEDVKLPPDKVLIPGVIDSTTNFIEHPHLVAQRLERYASVVGAERLIAGVDCGFASAAGWSVVDPRIAWAKLAAMTEGASLASQRLFR